MPDRLILYAGRWGTLRAGLRIFQLF